MDMQENLFNENSEETKDEVTKAQTKPVETRITGWTSLKEFSVECGITYEAVRQQVQKHSAVLEGHIKQIGKTRYLDSYAKKFLRAKKVNAKEPTPVLDTPVVPSPITTTSELETSKPSSPVSSVLPVNDNKVSDTSCALSSVNKVVSSVTAAQITEKLNAQKNEIIELKKKVRSLEDEIKQIEYDNVLSQSIIASMNSREFKIWKNKFKSQMRDTMDI